MVAQRAAETDARRQTQLLIAQDNIVKSLLTTFGVLFTFVVQVSAAKPHSDGTAIASPARTSPNVVLIFADDLGYGDLSCYGATKVQTPNIDRLAKEGRRFTDAHSASAVCTPSRYALLTGEYPFRKGIWGPCSHRQPLLIDTNKLTLAQMFKNAGYATSCFGKWHLGFGSGPTDWTKPLKPGPLELGFDYYFGVPKVNSGFPYVYVENHRVFGGDPEDPLVFNQDPFSPTPSFPAEAGRKSANRFGGAKKAHELYHDERIGTDLAQRATKWIDARDKQDPFFLYLATTHIHHPTTPAPRFKGTSQAGLYGDFIHELDWMVGDLLACLERNQIADDTIFIFTSDNGGMFNTAGQIAFDHGHKINGDLLGFKFGAWEGGHRVPFLVRWPGKVKAGTTSDQLISNIDLLATFAALTEQKLTKEERADSVNVLPAITGDPQETIREHLILAPNKRTHLSLRKGKWMYIPSRGSGGFTGRKPGDHTFAGPAAANFVGSENSDFENGQFTKDASPAQLYDLDFDLKQTKNIYREYPEVVKEMQALLASYSPKKATEKTPKQRRPRKPNNNPAPKTDAKPTAGTSFDFESGKLEPWQVVEGDFGHVIGIRDSYFNKKSGPLNKQGKHYLTTLEGGADAVKGSDTQTGVIVSPLFVSKGGPMTFRVGGGYGPKTYVALCLADGKELKKGQGNNSQIMQKVEWDLAPYAGKKMFLKVVDQSKTGWGHITVDNIQFEAELLTEYPDEKKAPAAKPDAVKKAPAHANPTPPAAKSVAKVHSVGAAGSPNVIFVLTDDLGYSDVGCYGATRVKTPHIDQLAAEGVRFTDFHTAASICSPSRAAFLTGGYPQRAGLYMGINPNRRAHWFLGLNPDEITINEQFKQRGYATHMVGKWHLGTEPEFLPRKQGFDTYYGMPCNFSHSPKFFDNDEGVFTKTPLDRLTELYTERVTKIIHESGDKPFFLYYAHNYPHTPYQAGEKFKGSSQDGVRGDIMQELDWGIGEMMKALKEAGIAENTIVIFTSDNGPTSNKYAVPYRGTKYVTFEGGHRVPFIFHWPVLIKEGGVSSANINALDVFPTLSEIIGADLPKDRIYDGESFLPLFKGQSLKRKTDAPFYYYNCENLQAIRSGDWKLHLARDPKQVPFWDKNKAFFNIDEPVLYNLREDRAETTDVASSNPKVVQRILKEAANTRQAFGEFMQRGNAQRPTGTLFPDVPVISHEKDWGTIPPASDKAIAKERTKRHPKSNQKKPRRRKKK